MGTRLKWPKIREYNSDSNGTYNDLNSEYLGLKAVQVWLMGEGYKIVIIHI